MSAHSESAPATPADPAPASASPSIVPSDEPVAGLGGESPYSEALHAAFNALNRWLAIPALRTGTGLLFMSPLVGYTCLLRTRGRNSGLVREAPLLYTIRDGAVYVVAGFGARTQWYRNIVADPRVEVVLPTRTVSGLASDVTAPDEWLARLRDLLRTGGFSGLLLGTVPWTASDDVLREKARGVKVVRIDVPGLAAGPADPGGLLWIPTTIAQGVLTAWLARAAARGVRRLLRLG
ncbi:MAG: nitroreductase/quinone reductase family protein [Chloroflexota bacterium]